MSSKIYFKKQGGVNVRRKLINVASRIHHKLAPNHAKAFAKKLLLTPVRPKRQVEEPAGLKREPVLTSEGQIMTYRLGSGPTWVLGHGWSGSSSQFFPLMEHIANAGYTALAFDNPAHGESEGRFGHLPAFVSALDQVLEKEPAIEGVIAHSMGGAMVLESRNPCLQNKPVLLVAPVLDYVDNLVTTVESSGFSMKLFQEVIDEIADSYQYSLDSIDPLKRLTSGHAKTVIVHDRGDRFASFATSEQASEMPHVTLIATEGLGHGRILKSEQLRQGFDLLKEAS
ncbi:esterase [Photobacterium jeanii]|uniref:Esterase n=1 Tax=Photobacterium jeanii TaxID=858640 RepID=A0A178KLJ0_9GAMM|nr:alpha/beta hydrolase [Photobacterium jeanii]OAN18258.1 esterase [Photobacterium jeanii]PST92064.1 alpha/beta hydrolase [Photobacterium jeanii]